MSSLSASSPSHAFRGGIWNIRSAFSKLSLVSQLVSDSDLDFILLTETWQIPSVAGKMDVFTSKFIELSGAECLDVLLFAKPRPGGRRGGGVALLCRRSISVVNFSVKFPMPSTFEFLTVKFCLNLPFVFIGLYRSPTSTSWSRFMCELRFLFISLCALSLPSVIAGDFNVKLNFLDDPNTRSFLRLLDEYNFVALYPVSPTHRLGNVLDFLIVSADFSDAFSSIVSDSTVEGSDHFPVLFSLDGGAGLHRSHVKTLKVKSFRNLRSLESTSFKKSLRDKLSPLLSSCSESFGEYLASYRHCITSVLDDLAPIHSKVVSLSSNPPWFDREYIHQKSIRKRLQNSSDKAAFNAQKRYCSYLVDKKRLEFYSSLVAEVASTNNQALLYKLLNKLTGRVNNMIDNLPFSSCNSDLANQFNRSFSSKVQIIRRSIVPSAAAADNVLIPSVPNTGSAPMVLDSFEPTSVEEITLIIKNSGVKTGPGDVLSPSLIKEHLDVLAPHFVNLVNLSLSSANCDGIKEAHIVPILKSLKIDKNDLLNYRPVSLLSFISKLTERVVHSRINEHLAANSLENHAQYGYKKKHSCETLLLKLIDDILVACDKNLGVVVMIIDLSAAFDTVDHSLLLNQLQFKYHIVGSALQWLKSFLSGRSQRVKVGDTLSDSLIVEFGVAQGSVLGPLLFNLYCSSISEVFAACSFDCVGFADDNVGTRVFPASATISVFESVIPNCLSAVKQWADSLFLKVNADKTKIMVFGNASFMSDFNIHTVRSFDGNIIPISREIKLLGVVLDSTLSFDSYTSEIIKSVNLTLRNIKLIRKFLSKDAVETLIHSLVTSKLDACNSLFIGLSKMNLCKLQVIQNSAIRCVMNIPAHSHVSQHYRDLHWLHVDKRIYFKFITYVFKCINNIAPVQLSTKLKLDCAFQMILDTSFSPSSELGRKSFTYMAPRCWNALPIELRVITTLEHFKSRLKTYLFTNFRVYMRNVDPYTSVTILHGDLAADDDFLINYLFNY